MGKIIQIVTVLFILSMIFERINEFLKHYLSCKKVVGVGWYIVGDTTTKFPAGSKEEKRREYRILKMNLFLGVLTSFLAHASFFDLLRNLDNPGKVIGWPGDFSLIFKDITFGTPFQFVIGCLFTGAFISMGSKFWHDLLDLLLYTKNLKQKLSSSETYEVTSADQLTEYLSFTEPDLVRLAIDQNDEVLNSKFPNIKHINDMAIVREGNKKHVAGIFLIDNNITGLPDKIPARLPSGKIYNIETQIIQDTGVARISHGLTGDVKGENFLDFPGSACCLLNDATRDYLLTNCHVLTGGFHKKPLFSVEDKVFYEDDKIGNWFYGNISPEGDLALVTIEDVNAFISDHNPELFKNRIRDIAKPDDMNARVTVRGNKCGISTDAFIVDVVINKLKVEYKEGVKQVFQEAIVLGDSPDILNCSPPTDFGDSGGAVYDSRNQLIGIITAKDNKYSYATPLKKFLTSQKLKIK